MPSRINLAYISLGSNLRPEVHLSAAVRELGHYGRVLAVSHAWQSAPWGFAAQPDFLNAAVLLETQLSGEWLIGALIPQIEQQLGRQRDPSNKNGPRTIDLDLSLWNSEQCTLAGKRIPDPAILEQVFVAQPLAEIAEDYLHPVTSERLGDIASRLAMTATLRRRDDVVLWPLADAPVVP